MTARVGATCASRSGATQRHAQPAPCREAWPTTLRFSRRLGETVRDAEYAAWMEGPGGRRTPHLQERDGLAGALERILDFLRRTLARP
ncbi:hypothetical protein [Ramlibacter montanisoli]|uniref:Uncharacterized protein n=1 Tax=Ramlibacter montanisoli TaxID=2732512 RepID=A0A849KB13_9BURK|nr:hypothetical protein [Ramlibacter montanisoli]NNU41991.1 hypothetical protein [Ramlibacter montanisoli]